MDLVIGVGSPGFGYGNDYGGGGIVYGPRNSTGNNTINDPEPGYLSNLDDRSPRQGSVPSSVQTVPREVPATAVKPAPAFQSPTRPGAGQNAAAPDVRPTNQPNINQPAVAESGTRPGSSTAVRPGNSPFSSPGASAQPVRPTSGVRPQSSGSSAQTTRPGAAIQPSNPGIAAQPNRPSSGVRPQTSGAYSSPFAEAAPSTPRSSVDRRLPYSGVRNPNPPASAAPSRTPATSPNYPTPGYDRGTRPSPGVSVPSTGPRTPDRVAPSSPSPSRSSGGIFGGSRTPVSFIRFVRFVWWH